MDDRQTTADMFGNRRLVVATRHAKERAIAPVLERELGLYCHAPEDFDTDQLGTFTGEIERSLDPLETAREKCRRAMDLTGSDLAVASEGSFGPHPVMVFVPCGDELLLLADRRHGLEIVVRDLSTETNFATAAVDTEAALLAFADKAGFPSHALILRRARDSHLDIHKGITDRQQLLDTYRQLVDRHGSACVETDMRAMHNPMRMRRLEVLAQQLVERIRSTCPSCAMPGFAVTEMVRGLPCELCRLPTNATSRLVSVCEHCGHRQDQPRPDGKTAENPMYCDFCNP
jgi:hypothetical protein